MTRFSSSSLFAFTLFWLSNSSVWAAVLVKDKMWPANSTLNVVFIDGTAAQKAQVQEYAPLWLEDTSLKFRFYDGWRDAPRESHIRVSFLSHTGSTLGNHGDLLSREPTLLLAEIATDDLPQDYARRYILHEFGHALGFEHEYRNPKWPYGMAAIETQISDCFPRLEKLGYSQTDAKRRCREINGPLAEIATYSTVFDEYSIMNYPQVIDLAGQGEKRIHAKSQLSVLDKVAIQRWYNQNGKE